MTIEAGCTLNNLEMYVKGSVTISNDTLLISEDLRKQAIIIDGGSVIIGHHVKISARRIWVRFGGILKIGNYTNINSNSEIRCDEKIDIGSYNQISYNVRIWDTNTHTIYPALKRREIAEKYYPYFGFESEKPKTKPIFIGNDCWIGENSTILKGSSLENEVVIGFGTTISKRIIYLV